MKVKKAEGRRMSVHTQEHELAVAKSKYIHIRDKYLEECAKEGREPDHDLLEIKYKGLKPRSVREAILIAIGEEKASIKQIITRVQGMDNFHDNAIRNEVSKLLKNKVISKVATGIYIKKVKDGDQLGTKNGKVVVLEGSK